MRPLQQIVLAVFAAEIVEMVAAEHDEMVQAFLLDRLDEALDKGTSVGRAGDNVGCLLRKTAHDEVHKGQVLAARGSVTPRRQFEAEVYVLKKEQGGRHTPFFDGYTPQFFFRTTNVTGKTHVIGDVQMAMSGDGVQLKVNLLQPIALTNGDHFAIREGGKTVGSGVVTKVTA